MVLHRVTHITRDLRKAQTLQILPFSIFTPPWPFFTALPFSRVQMVFWRSNGHLTFDHVFGDQMAPQVCRQLQSRMPQQESLGRDGQDPIRAPVIGTAKEKGRVRKVVQKVQKAHHPCRRTCMANGTALNRVTLFVSASTPAQVAQRKGLSLESVVAKDSMCALNLVVSSAIH